MKSAQYIYYIFLFIDSRFLEQLQKLSLSELITSQRITSIYLFILFIYLFIVLFELIRIILNLCNRAIDIYSIEF